MVTLSFDDVTLTMSANDYRLFRNFMVCAIDSVPIDCLVEFQELLMQVGMGFATDTRLYKEKIVDESR
jgi:hypothetical protein